VEYPLVGRISAATRREKKDYDFAQSGQDISWINIRKDVAGYLLESEKTS
jgi:hypothetical protein